MSADRQQLLEQALRQTHRMLALASEDAWREVVALEAERRAILEQAFATREPLTESLAAQVREILALDQVLMEASLRLRDQIGSELGELSRGRRGTEAYRATA
ncbi:MAG: flagellar protein FliT [Gammaproteobacteria bacterium]|nr:MAG: flagellar protein FliT [Gammaproteobacteria bacterium]